jgi:hypothetical protein
VCFLWYLANQGAKDGLQCATSIGITLQRFILYTLASLVVLTLPKFHIYAYVQEHICRGSYHYLVGFYGAYPNSNIELKYWIRIIKSKQT